MEHTLLFVFIVVLIIIYFINKIMRYNHELKKIEKLGKQSPKKIKAQADYKKASENRGESIFKLLRQLIKMLFTLF